MEVAGEPHDGQDSAIQGQSAGISEEQAAMPALPSSDDEQAPAASDSAASATPIAPIARGAVTLPPINRAADLARVTTRPIWVVLCFTVSFAIYVSLIGYFLRFSSPPTGDQPFYLMDTLSLWQDGDLELTNNYAAFDFDKFYGLAPRPADFVGMSAPYPLTPMLANATARPPTEQYSFHLPGLAVLMLPAWAIGSLFSLWWPATIVFMCIMGALVGVNAFLLAHETTGKLWIAFAVWLPVAFSGPIMSYSYLIFTEMPTGLLVIYAFRRLAQGWEANGPWRLLLVGLCIAYIPWLAWRCVPIAAALGVYALVQWWRARVEGRKVGRLEGSSVPTFKPSNLPTFNLLLVVVPVAISAVLVAWYNLYLFGAIIPNGSVLEQGQIAIFHWPWNGPDESPLFLQAVFGLLFDQQFGLLVYTPVYLLAAVGMIAIFRMGGWPGRRLLLWMGLVSLPYLFVIAAFDAWQGVYCPPARYLSTFAPMLAAPLAMSLFAFSGSILGGFYKLLYAVMSAVGIALMGLLMVDPRNFWPIPNPSLFIWLAQSPPYPFLHMDLIGVLSNFDVPDDVTHPMTSAWIIGGALAIVLLCYLFVQFQRTMRSERRMWFAFQGVLWLASIGVIGLGWYGMNNDYLKPKTVLTEVKRWELIPPPQRSGGMAYLDGKLYLTGFENQHVGVFDLTTETYNLVYPISAQGVLTFSHPGDIKVGPDGMLYLLNNGQGTKDVYVMRPDGGVVKQLPLPGKTWVSVGLDFGPDGKMYVADMVGAHIFRYDLKGGMPLDAWTGMAGGYNNIAGVTVDKEGMIYGLETGFQRIQQFDSTGRFIRKYQLGCQPNYAVIDGDWMDVTCTPGFRSINLKEHYIQLSREPEGFPKLQAPTSIAYGPNHTLYVLDGTQLIEYKVQH